MSMPDYAALRPYATVRQSEILDAVETAGGNQSEAARQLGISRETVKSLLATVQKKAARTDPAQHDYKNPLPPSFHIRGVSQQLGPNGELISQWVKSAADPEERTAALLEIVKGIAERLPVAPVIPAPAPSLDDILCVYPMGDPHIGMYAWAEECGASFDLDIAERQISAAIGHLVALAPEGSDALIVDVGDFFHSDTMDNRTRKSGHALDVDSRWAKVLRTGLRTMTSSIDFALTRHRRVHVIIEIGNHDDQSSVFLAICLAEHYRDNPRVFIDTSPAPFHYYRFGDNLIGVTHGLVKAAQLGPIMACDRPQDWGATKHRYWYTGHIHHDSAKEFPGVMVESFRTLAPRDAWHNGQGYRSGQDMKLDIVHRTRGRINRHSIGIEDIRALMSAPAQEAA